MFSYVDSAVKKKLVESGKLVCIDSEGNPCPRAELERHPFISIVGPVPLPVHLDWGEDTFNWYAWVRNSDLARIEDAVHHVREEGPGHLFALLTHHMAVNSILVKGDLRSVEAPLVRVHSNCLTGDVLGSQRCDCGPQLHEALHRISEEGVGALVYMAGHEGRGIGLWAKAITYLLQDAGHDTYQANEKLGLPADSRNFRDAARVLRYFVGQHPRIRLMGNNPLKQRDLEAHGIEIVEQQPLLAGLSRHNTRYLTAKKAHGHLIPDGALEEIGTHLDNRNKR